MNKRLSVSAVVSSIILAACGGGGSGTEPKSTALSAPVTTQQVTEPVELLSSQPILLPDLKPKYDKVCGRNTNAQHAIPVDINKDNKMDLVINLWCLRPENEMGKAYNGDVPNSLVALVQESNGKFVDKTLEVFGNDLPSINGIGIDSVVHDFNNDGVQDIIFAVNREDGRLADNGTLNHKASSVALMSDGQGKYKIINLTKPEYGYRVVLKENTLGNQDVVMLPFEQPSAYTYNNGWQKLNGYDWVNNTATTFFKSISPGLGSTIAIVPSPHPRTGVELWNGTNNSWRKVDEYKFPEPTLVYMKSWSGNLGLAPMFTIDGKDYISPNISDSCELTRNSNNNKESLVVFSATEIIGGYKGQTINEGDTNLKSMSKLMVFDTNNGNALSKKDLSIKNEITSGTIWKVVCNDFDKDGLTDISYHQPMGGAPSDPNFTYPGIFMNDGNGNYNRVARKWFPRPGNGVTYIYEDMNGDGIRDLLYYPLTGYNGHDTDHGVLAHGHLIQSNSVTYHLYIGKRKIKSSDMME